MLSREDYYNEIKQLTKYFIEEIELFNEGLDRYDFHDKFHDKFYEMVHEKIDGHMWIIWYDYNIEVLKCSNNPNAYFQEFGKHLLSEDWQQVIQMMAFSAMYDDIMEEYNRLQTV